MTIPDYCRYRCVIWALFEQKCWAMSDASMGG